MTKITKAIANFDKDITGFVCFEQINKHNCKVTFNLSGFASNAKHAIHIHEYGDMSNGCKSLGGHYNPYNHNHGSYDYNTKRHVGDLINNLKSDSNGDFMCTYIDDLIQVDSKKNNIIGRSVVIHKGIDDCGFGNDKESLITGNAGKRIACAIIGIKQ